MKREKIARLIVKHDTISLFIILLLLIVMPYYIINYIIEQLFKPNKNISTMNKNIIKATIYISYIVVIYLVYIEYLDI